MGECRDDRPAPAPGDGAASAGRGDPALRARGALLRAILGGSRTHFELLYESYFPRVYGLALRLSPSVAEAEATTAAVLERVVRELPAWDERERLPVWILRLCREELALSALRRTPAPPRPGPGRSA